ncbi:MAG TPA: hypothetical protein VKX96_15190, partial [Chloroflexota bacterium]|nr:hypothetical protein [Chloroflexota bacterium]
ADAVGHLVSVRRDAVYPIRLSGRLQVLAILGILLAILPWVVPWSTIPALRPRPSLTAAVSRAEADRLDQVANRLEQQDNPQDQTTRSALANQLRQVADQLRRDGGNAQQATRDLQRAQQLAAKTAPQTGEDASLTLARIADALNNSPTTRPITQALDQQNLAQALAALNQAADQLGSLSQSQRDALAQALQAASDAARGSDTNAAQQLQQAAQAAQNGDSSGLQQAAQALQQLSNASQAQSDASQAQSEMQASSEAISQAAQGGSSSQSSSSNQAGSATRALARARIKPQQPVRIRVVLSRDKMGRVMAKGVGSVPVARTTSAPPRMCPTQRSGKCSYLVIRPARPAQLANPISFRQQPVAIHVSITATFCPSTRSRHSRRSRITPYPPI